jgi:glycosyltransferase involved in cell wall biosynthesis
MHSPFVPEVMDALLYRWLVYDSTDDFSQFTEDAAIGEQVVAADAAIARRADLNLTVSERLTCNKSELSDCVVRIPNGCDYEHFAAAGLTGPILGYFGRADLFRKLDYPLLMFLALRHPDWQIVLIGPAQPEQSELRLPNIHFLGHQSYERLPELASAFDVCLIPHRVNRLTESMDPIKIYEYLATGKPIVSTPVAGAERFAAHVSICDTWTSFEEGVEIALRSRGRGAKGRQQVASEQSWSARFSALEDALERHCFAGRMEPAPAAIR